MRREGGEVEYYNLVRVGLEERIIGVHACLLIERVVTDSGVVESVMHLVHIVSLLATVSQQSNTSSSSDSNTNSGTSTDGCGLGGGIVT